MSIENNEDLYNFLMERRESSRAQLYSTIFNAYVVMISIVAPLSLSLKDNVEFTTVTLLSALLGVTMTGILIWFPLKQCDKGFQQLAQSIKRRKISSGINVSDGIVIRICRRCFWLPLLVSLGVLVGIVVKR